VAHILGLSELVEVVAHTSTSKATPTVVPILAASEATTTVAVKAPMATVVTFVTESLPAATWELTTVAVPMEVTITSVLVEMVIVSPAAIVTTPVLVPVILLSIRWNHHRLTHVSLAASAMIRVK
jgi:hypothetical protein